MRLRITFLPSRLTKTLPIDYQYYLSAALYHWFELSSPSFATFLHDVGYSPEALQRRFRLFCFSNLFIPHTQLEGNRLVLLQREKITWYVSMPIDDGVKHLVTGMFEQQRIYIEEKSAELVVHTVEILPEPSWERKMHFRMLSALTISVPVEYNGKLSPRYLHVDDSHLNTALRQNILRRYEALYGTVPDDTEFHCTFDEAYIAKRGGPSKITKLVTIKKGLPDETKVRGFVCPLTIEGNPQLIRLAYESGLGEKGSMGFGMIDIL